jgi:hypothetical protein
MSLFNLTLNKIVKFCSTHADLLPLTGVGGIVDEPALSICNDAISDLLTEPNDWKFNSVFMPTLVTAPNRQDYIFAGASAFTLGNPSSGACIDLASNSAITVTAGVVTVNTTQSHRFSVGNTVYLNAVTMTTGDDTKYNSTFTDNGNSSTWSGGWVITAVTTFSFSFAATSGQENGDIGGAPGISNYGFLTEATLVELNNSSSPQNVLPLRVVKGIPVWSKVATPEKVCVVQDRGDGTLLIRFYYVPGSAVYGMNAVFQARAPLKVTLADNWSPFPDNFQALYRQAVLVRMYRYLNSPRAEVEYQKLQAEIAKAQGFDDNEDNNIYLEPEESLMDGINNFWSF